MYVRLCVLSCFEVSCWKFVWGWGQAHKVCGHIFEATPPGVKGHPGVNLPYNVLWLPNLVRRTPDQSIVYCWGQRSCRGHLGSTRGQILRNTLWPPNLVGRIPKQSIMHCWGQSQRSWGVSWGQVGVNLLSNALWPPKLKVRFVVINLLMLQNIGYSTLNGLISIELHTKHVFCKNANSVVPTPAAFKRQIKTHLFRLAFPNS